MSLRVGKTQLNVKGINEERQFTNPHVRFRRIRGKIVPIVNKKRVGQDITAIGESAFIKGSALAGLSMLIKKSLFGKKSSKHSGKFKMKSPSLLSIKKTDNFKVKGIKKSLKLSGGLIKSSFKHSGKIGIGIAASGVALKFLGDEIQARSPFGKDFFFVKDRQGRGS